MKNVDLDHGSFRIKDKGATLPPALSNALREIHGEGIDDHTVEMTFAQWCEQDDMTDVDAFILKMRAGANPSDPN